MNLITVANLNKPYLNVLLERGQAGHFIASVPELTDCVAWAETRDSAIAKRCCEAQIALLTPLQTDTFSKLR